MWCYNAWECYIMMKSEWSRKEHESSSEFSRFEGKIFLIYYESGLERSKKALNGPSIFQTSIVNHLRYKTYNLDNSSYSQILYSECIPYYVVNDSCCMFIYSVNVLFPCILYMYIYIIFVISEYIKYYFYW